MRRDVQEIFRSTPHGKQVMMFSATLSKDIRPVCKKFMQDVNINVFITKMLVLLHLASTAITTISYYFVNATRYRFLDLDPPYKSTTILQMVKRVKPSVQRSVSITRIEKISW